MLEFLIPLTKAQNFTSSASKAVKGSTSTLENLLQFLLERIDNWIAAAVIIILTFFVARIIRKIVVDKMSDRLDEEHQDIVSLVERISYVSVIALGVTIGLKIAGIDLTAIIAAVGFGIGFALKDLIMNFAAGIVVLLSRQFNIGDYININDTIGKVIGIQSRCTVLESLDGTKIIVPNSDLFSKQVISYTTNTFRRVDVPVGVDYNTDLTLAMRVAMETMQKHPEVIKAPSPVVLLDQFADSSINLICRFWVESKSNWLKIKSEIILNLKKNFDQVNINIPFPIRTVYFANELQEVTRKHGEQKEVPEVKIMPVIPQGTTLADLSPASSLTNDATVSADLSPTQPDLNAGGKDSTRTGEEFLSSIRANN